MSLATESRMGISPFTQAACVIAKVETKGDTTSEIVCFNQFGLEALTASCRTLRLCSLVAWDQVSAPGSVQVRGLLRCAAARGDTHDTRLVLLGQSG
jgi:hypothetical protein